MVKNASEYRYMKDNISELRRKIDFKICFCCWRINLVKFNSSFINCFISLLINLKISVISKFLNNGKTKCYSNLIRQIQDLLMKIEETVRLFLSRILNTPATELPSFVNKFIGNNVLTFKFWGTVCSSVVTKCLQEHISRCPSDVARPV